MTKAKLWIGFFISVALLAACSKNSYTSTPDIKLQSYSPGTVAYNSIFSFTFTLTEKKYNPGDTLTVIMTSKNCSSDTTTPYYFTMASLASGIPSTTSGSGFKGNLVATFSNGAAGLQGGYPDVSWQNPCPIPGGGGNKFYPDTTYFRFVLGSGTHFSDTVDAGPVILIPNNG